jgi:hypothetical protein
VKLGRRPLAGTADLPNKARQSIGRTRDDRSAAAMLRKPTNRLFAQRK